ACEFAMDEAGSASPFIVSREIREELFQSIKICCHKNGATVNDFVLAAYFRALSEMLDIKGKELSIPIMIDMRRYLKDKSFMALTNLASTTIVKASVLPDESFIATLAKISSIMNKKKSGKLGMNTFLKLDAGFRIPFVNAYRIMSKTLRHPKTAMTNIGIIDSSKLVFANLPVDNAVMYASIKYRPHLQLSVTSFNDKMTLGIGLYGSDRDREKINTLLDYLVAELKSSAVTESCLL
ncbi:MAG: WS/DGAT domain-containing protein, partial [Oscillospiraceae bacterium]